MGKEFLCCLEAKVNPLRGKVITEVATVEEFLEKAHEMGANDGYGFYNPSRRIGVVFPGLDQAYSLDSWNIVQEELSKEFKNGFNIVALKTGEII